MSQADVSRAIRERTARETGGVFTPGSRRVALAYPSPYRAGMSSLGFQWILQILRESGLAVERVFLPDDVEAQARGRVPPLSYETLTPLGRFPIIGVSLAYELELEGLVRLLDLAGIPPLRRDRGPGHPKIVIGGPLTFSNPLPAAPYADVMILGEAEDAVSPVFHAFFDGDEAHFLDVAEAAPGGFVPSRHGVRLPPVAKAADDLLPARSSILAPEAELSSMFLLEGERGCHRACTFCVMRRSTNGGMRLVTPDRILGLIPEEAKRVGLVGAAISDHPQLVGLLESLVGSGREVGLSSLRADRVALKPKIAELLRASGARTLTVASDAASARLRRTIEKGTTEKHLIECARIAGAHRFDVFKVYMMVGLPDEHDEDLDELVRFTLELAGHTRVALGVAPFVAKRNTPLDGAPFAGIKEVDARLARLSKGLRGRAEVRPVSARWAWVEYVLAQGGPAAGEAVLHATRAGGRFADYKKAFADLPASDFRPWAADGWSALPAAAG